MVTRQLPFLTYLAQLRQLPSRNAKQNRIVVLTMPRILPILLNKKYGVLHKVIVIIGTAPGAGWAGLNRNTGEWFKVADSWRKQMICTSLQSPVGERK